MPSIVDWSGVPILLCLGELDMVVAAVVAVLGRSAVDIAAAEEGGNFPVSSNLRMRDLRSSSSSQTVEGALVEIVDDSVCSASFGRSTKPGSETR